MTAPGLWAEVGEMSRPTSPNAPEALATASYLLWVLTGRRWSGVHTITEEYVCDDYRHTMVQEIQFAENHIRQLFVNDFPGVYGSYWGEYPGQRILFLRNRPARELLALRRLSGEELDPGSYAIYDHAFVAPAHASCCDPCFDPCCMEVTYTWGTLPPPPGKAAVLDLADEFVKSIECPDECKLPERVTSVSRQGVSYEIFDAQDFMSDGRVGIYSVDVFIKAVNPDRAQKRPRVFNVDMVRAREKTWPTLEATPFGRVDRMNRLHPEGS